MKNKNDQMEWTVWNGMGWLHLPKYTKEEHHFLL